MSYKTFSTFEEASLFARNNARELDRTVRLERKGNKFIVETGFNAVSKMNETIQVRRKPTPITRSNVYVNWHKRHIEERQKKEDKEKTLRELEKKTVQIETGEPTKIKPHLYDRKYFESLNEIELENAWMRREESDMEEDEKLILRSVLRDRKGIKPVCASDATNNTTFCPRCSFLVSNCTCERGWW